MMNLEVWCPAISSFKRSRFLAMLTYAICEKKNLSDNIRIAAIASGSYLDPVWLPAGGGKPLSSLA
jgi:hypothetical protein